MAEDIAGIIEDAYQAECERFDPEIERTDADVFACRHDLLRAARTPRMRALVDRLIEAEEAAVKARWRGFFAAGIAAGIRIGLKTAAAPWEGPSALETILDHHLPASLKVLGKLTIIGRILNTSLYYLNTL